jgi:PKD repeat protein
MQPPGTVSSGSILPSVRWPPSTRAALRAAFLTVLFAGLLPAAAAADTPPTAAFDMTVDGQSVTTVKPGTRVAFTDRSTDRDGSIVRRGWDINGDGTITDQDGPATVSRPYGRGTFTILLRVTDDAGNTAEARKILNVVPPGQAKKPQPQPQQPPPAPAPAANRAPVASFGFSPSSPTAGEAVTFVSGATDSDGRIATQEWDLDNDGQYDDGTGPSARTTYATAGERTATLRVTDDRGAVNVAFRSFTVLPPPAAASSLEAPAIAVLPQGATRPAMRYPKLTVRIRGKILPTTIQLQGLSVKAPTGFKATAYCKGRGCPFAKATRRVRKGFARFDQLKRSMRPGTIIRVTVTKPLNWGRYTSLRLRRGAAPERKDRCLRGESTRPVKCPS